MPFGEKLTPPIRGSAGNVTVRSAPSGIARSVRLVEVAPRCGPFVRGLMRIPPSRSIGCAISSIGGMLERPTTAMTLRVGPMITVGSGSAVMMSAIGAGRREIAGRCRAGLCVDRGARDDERPDDQRGGVTMTHVRAPGGHARLTA